MKSPKLSEAQILLALHCKELGWERIEYEYRFHPARKWRCDLAVFDIKALIEVDGGMFSGGHKRGGALEDDYIKQNEAQAAGWKLYRFSNRQVMSGDAKKWLGSLYLGLRCDFA